MDGIVFKDAQQYERELREKNVNNNVAPDYRRQGIYTSLYHAVCEDAKKDNVAQVRLYVDKTNTRGQQVYASLGMQESHYLIYETTL